MRAITNLFGIINQEKGSLVLSLKGSEFHVKKVYVDEKKQTLEVHYYDGDIIKKIKTYLSTLSWKNLDTMEIWDGESWEPAFTLRVEGMDEKEVESLHYC